MASNIRARLSASSPGRMIIAVVSVLLSLFILWLVLNYKNDPASDGSVVILRLDPLPDVSGETSELIIGADPATNLDTPPVAAEVPTEDHPDTETKPAILGVNDIDTKPKPSTSPTVTGAIKLVVTPVNALMEPGPHGPLPVISADGKRAMDVYARPFDLADTRPRISIIIGGLGLSKQVTQNAIDKLPGEISFAFAPYGGDLQAWVDKAKNKGHEALLELPMEPFDYPDNDPGPFTLLTTNSAAQNTERLKWLLGRFHGYTGTINYLGAKLTSTPEPLLPILEQLADRGVMFIDDGSSQRSLTIDLAEQIGLPASRSIQTIDIRASKSSIDERLLELEEFARRDGSAIGMGYAYPVTVERLTSWAKTLNRKGLVLAPVSAQVRGQSETP